MYNQFGINKRLLRLIRVVFKHDFNSSEDMAQLQWYICWLLKQATHTLSLSMMPAVALRAQGLLGLSAAFMAKPHLPDCLHSLRSVWRSPEFLFVSSSTSCVLWPLLCPLLPKNQTASSFYFDFWRQTLPYVAHMRRWKSCNGNSMWHMGGRGTKRKWKSPQMSIIFIRFKGTLSNILV